MTTNIYDMADTWNNAGTTFNAIKMNISNGSGGAPVAAATSRSIRIQSNGTDIFASDISGFIYVGANGSSQTLIGSPVAAAFPGIWFGANATAPADFTNYSFLYDVGTPATIFNAPTGNIQFRFSNSPRILSNTTEFRAGQTVIFNWSSNTDVSAAAADTGMSRVGAADIAFGNGTAADATALIRCGSLRINQTPTANTSATTTITNGADSATNLGHRVSFNLNGTTYWIPCGNTAF